MYVPPAFAVTDPDVLFAFMARHSFALLVSADDREPFASHVPLLAERVGPVGLLRGHLAKANPHWKQLDGRRVLAVFSGPHAYVSPTWYESPNTVPTWNYTAVHAYGACRLVTDPAAVAEVLTDTVAVYEAGMPEPWSIDAGGEFFRGLANGVVGFEVELDRLEGKWKLNQNHTAERRARVAAALLASSDPAARAVGKMMSDRGV